MDGDGKVSLVPRVSKLPLSTAPPNLRPGCKVLGSRMRIGMRMMMVILIIITFFHDKDDS